MVAQGENKPLEETVFGDSQVCRVEGQEIE